MMTRERLYRVTVLDYTSRSEIQHLAYARTAEAAADAVLEMYRDENPDHAFSAASAIEPVYTSPTWRDHPNYARPS